MGRVLPSPEPCQKILILDEAMIDDIYIIMSESITGAQHQTKIECCARIKLNLGQNTLTKTTLN